MMPNSAFIIIAGLMIIAAIATVVIPLVRRGESSPIAAGAVIALLPLTAALLYFSYSNWRWDEVVPPEVAHTDQAGSLAEMVTRLEQKLQDSPGDAEGWQMLGRSYVALSRYSDAVAAYTRARELTADKDVNALTGYAEALAMVRGGQIDQEVATLFEQALQLSPDDRKGLWYGGLAAFESGQPGQARSRWQRLLDLGPPEQMAVLLREQIAAANAALGNAAAALPVPTTAPAAATAAAGPGLQLQVTLAPELAGRTHPDAPVFILARQAGVPGPPLAVVRRRVADLPLELLLTDADSMVAGRLLSGHQSVEVIARIALGGTPTAQSGDLSGSKIVARNGNAVILIDSIVQK